ncbi:hypothetical protein ACFU5O_16585 [Streptomyces sp. NPDC057445]|uniref:hypothetical protein n=1 Tax=Streptomyces sp. NPDC057445 TaxID=3346136 RepID=UPI00369B693C
MGPLPPPLVRLYGSGEAATDSGNPGTGFRPAPRAAEPAPPSPSLAGREAGEGRKRPGRTAPPLGDAPEPPESGHVREAEHDRGSDQGRGHAHDRENGNDRDRAPDHGRTPGKSKAPQRDTGDKPVFLPPAQVPPPVHPTRTAPVAPAAVGKAAPQSSSAPLERKIPILTLGTGFALMGIGLGYMGLRLRRY